MTPSAGEMYFTSILDELVSEMFVKSRMGQADWTLTLFANLLSKTKYVKHIEKELKLYAEAVNTATKSNIKLKKKYYLLNNIWLSLNPPVSSPDLT